MTRSSDDREARRLGLAALGLALVFVGGVALGRTRRTYADGSAPALFHPIALGCAAGAFLLGLAAIQAGLSSRRTDWDASPGARTGVAGGVLALLLVGGFLLVSATTGMLE